MSWWKQTFCNDPLQSERTKEKANLVILHSDIEQLNQTFQQQLKGHIIDRDEDVVDADDDVDDKRRHCDGYKRQLLMHNNTLHKDCTKVSYSKRKFPDISIELKKIHKMVAA